MNESRIVTWLGVLAAMAALWPLPMAEAASASRPATTGPSSPGGNDLTYETLALEGGDAPATLNLAWRTATVPRHPVILMLGSLKAGELPAWSTDLVNEGYMLVAFSVAHPPDPDPARRAQWLFFDQRFAHGYVLGGERVPRDSKRIIDYVTSRPDVHPEKIGWLGSSSTGIPGLAVATREPRLKAIVAFVSTGAYRLWLQTWHTNQLWRGKTPELWPETLKLLKTVDPILHVDTMFPKAVLMVSGGNDKVVDPATARAFVEAARPYYESDPDRLRLVVYEGFGHNLPGDVVKMYAEHWFRLYIHPTQPPPPIPQRAKSLSESVIHTQINAADHKDVVGAK